MIVTVVLPLRVSEYRKLAYIMYLDYFVPYVYISLVRLLARYAYIDLSSFM